MSLQNIPAAKRAEWRAWVVQQMGDNERVDDQVVDRATDAVLTALLQGASMEDAMAAGRATAQAKPPSGQVGASHLVSDDTHLRGQVAAFRQRSEFMGSGWGTVWDFRVDHWDKAGVPEPPVAVEMRGLHIVGSVGDGDWVEITGRWQPGKVLTTRSLLNLTQNALVVSDASGATRVRALGSQLLSVLKMLVLVLVFGFLIFVGLQVLSSGPGLPWRGVVPRSLL